MRILLQTLVIAAVVGLLVSCEQDSDRKVESVESSQLDQLIRNPISYKGVDTAAGPELTFDQEIIHFDTVKLGDVVERVFEFTNTGKSPLWISNARSTCGCTVPDFPKEPIAPGERGEILVRFNTADRPEYQDRPVTIYANTIPGRTVVRLQGYVLDPDLES
ncbi:MAG: DUF1573 domain-containing protein [Saprospirales bacterium]|nr:MAG: DUF1573 domain-containing protein [Saprospirales bacterium]